MSEAKVIDINKLGMRPQQRKIMVMAKTDNGVSGMSGLVEQIITEMVPTSHLNEEDAWLVAEAGAEWRQTPKSLKAHPKWMTSWGGKRWFADKKPTKPKAEPAGEADATDDLAEITSGPPKRKRGRPAKKSTR